jgi:anti-anti-sigma factor
MVAAKGREPEPGAPIVEVELRPTRAPAFVAAVRLRGEHDMATAERIRDVLAPIDGSVLVDLSECSFIDSSAINAFVTDAQRRAREGHRLELLVPAENAVVARTLEISGLDVILPVRRFS